MTENYIAIGFGVIGAIMGASLVGRLIADRYIRKLNRIFPGSELEGRDFVDRVMKAEGLEVNLESVRGVRGEFLFKEGVVKVPELENSSLLTLGISAHELAHASQASSNRALVVVTALLEKLGVLLTYVFPVMVILGLTFYFPLLPGSLVLYLLIFLIILAKIPLEVDASRKALIYLDRYGELSEEEVARLKKLLGLAILTRLTDLAVGFLVLVDLNEEW